MRANCSIATRGKKSQVSSRLIRAAAIIMTRLEAMAASAAQKGIQDE
jgi:hypothetical protein